METTTVTSEEVEGSTRSFLSFKLDNERFAVDVDKVIEILEVPKITKIPKAPDYMQGVINLRGNVLPVIDIHIKFGMKPTEMTVDTCIIVMNIVIDGEGLMVGSLVDAVEEVLEIGSEQISPSPSIGNKYRSEFIEGMTKVNDNFIMILNIDKVFSADEISQLKETTEKKETKKESKNEKVN